MARRVHVILLSLMLAILGVRAEAQATNTFPANGNVGIGTTAPGSELTMSNPTTNTFQILETGYNTAAVPTTYSLGANGSLVVGGALSVFSEGSPSYRRYLDIIADGTGGGAGSVMRFFTGNVAPAERMRIDQNGNVGIGTTTPGVGLHLYGSGASNKSQIRLQDSDSGGVTGYIQSYSGYLSLGESAGSATDLVLKSGKVGIGTASPSYKLDVAGQIHVSTGVVYPDGTQQTTAWTGVVCGGDYAESVDVTGDRTHYAPGDVLVITPDAPGKFLKSAMSYSTLVTGIYSTKPGTVGRRQTTPKSPDEVPMAMMGIVPTKVSAENGAIRPGDLLVTASKPGFAMKGTDLSRMLGAVIGKALGKLDSGTGVIEVVVTLQ